MTGRFIAGDQTFAMSGITSVKSSRQDPSRTGPIVFGIMGLVTLLAGRPGVMPGWTALPNAPGAGLAIFLGAFIYLFAQKTESSVLLTTASGEVKALPSRDAAFVSKVVAALNDSIVHRG